VILLDRINSAKQRKIGTFVPCFVHHPGEGQMELYPTVPQDIASIVDSAKDD
jgi:hypothetical protein